LIERFFTYLDKFKNIYSVLLSILGFVILISCSGDTNLTSSGSSEKKDSVTFNLEIKDDKLSIDSSSLKVTQGDQVVLNIVKSDQEGIFHLHGYGLAARVGLEKSGTIEFEANATGNFVMAFHPHSTEMKQDEHSTEMKQDEHSTEMKSPTEDHIVLGKFQVYPR
jgi:hypothetical protein